MIFGTILLSIFVIVGAVNENPGWMMVGAATFILYTIYARRHNV